MAFLFRVTTAAAVFVTGCTIYSPALLTSSDETGGASGAAGAGNTCETGSSCVEAGRDAASGGGGTGVTDAGTFDAAIDAGPQATMPYVSSTTLSPNIGVGLSTEGTLDWAHWGLKLATDYDHKAIAKPLISLSTPTAKARSQYVGAAPTFVWTDGMPTAMASTNTGIQIASAAVGDGFIVTAPASADVRHLRLYVGMFSGTADILIKLSSSKGVDATLADQVTSETEAWEVQVITVEFQDQNPQGVVAVSWVIKVAATAKAAIHLAATTLQ